jgi:hypothetical protein
MKKLGMRVKESDSAEVTKHESGGQDPGEQSSPLYLEFCHSSVYDLTQISRPFRASVLIYKICIIINNTAYLKGLLWGLNE